MVPSRDESMTDERFENLERRMDEVEHNFAAAFPNGDHVGHCRYHSIMIEQIEERRRLRIAVQEKTISGLVWAAIVGIGLAAWAYVKAQVKG